jgi:alkylation response protein AidB-like acyl-CoA dehydrogenase
VTGVGREAAFREFLERVAQEAVEREQQRTLLHAEVAELLALGFGAQRLPVEAGGAGVSLEALFARLIDLSAADANLGHLWRGHVAFVEGLLLDGPAASTRWTDRVAAGDFVGNAQSERQETGAIITRLDRGPDGITLTGTKYYTTGSIYADWIHLAALDGDVRVELTVSTRRGGVRSVDDWDGFGQPLTGSGTTTFDAVPVDADDIDSPAHGEGRWPYLGSILQLHLVAVVAGIAQRALDDTVAYVRPRRRTFGFAGETLPREDPLVQLVVGELSGAARVARRLVLSVAAELGDAVRRGSDPEELRALQLEVFRLQEVVPRLVLEASTRLFEVGGASAVSTRAALDRHWRNVRTLASHNPVAQRTRAIGQWELLGTLPEWKAPAR